MALPSISGTPRSHLSTPKSLINKRLAAETPECFTSVTVETPVASKRKNSKDSYDELSNLTVAVRVRPMNSKELSHVGASMIVRVQKNELLIRSVPVGAISVGTDHLFQYDHVFWSCDKTGLNYASQEDVFSSLGRPLLANAFQGYNACLFAYGQTGSGKSYSMMGPENDADSSENAGIIPRFCRQLFLQIAELSSSHIANVEVSYFEIYNEKIHDLLAPENGKPRKARPALKVREHPVWGPYVVNLSVHVVQTYEELRSWLLRGNKNRATAATVMNEKSSRSHSIFSIELSLSEKNKEDKSSRRSKVSLVDLAGSERLGSSYNCEEKMKQGVSINKSLLTLGKVISALAEQRKGVQFVPYRESVLTWLLRESLGGNSHTTMLATISPSNAHSDETLSTLRYACQARSIVNRARVNEDPNDRLIRELRAEVERLRALRLDYERSSSSTSSIIQIDDDSISSESGQELKKLKRQLMYTEEKLLKAQHEWEQRFMETKEQQMKELLEVEKEKEELESHVRVLSNVNTNVDLSPYQTNFLDELEDILTLDKVEDQRIKTLKGLCNSKQEYDYEISSSPLEKTLYIVDRRNNMKTSCPVNEIENVTDEDQFNKIIEGLNWINIECEKKISKRLSRSDVYGPLKQIYDALNALKFVTEDDESTRLAFAKFSKSFQVFETALQNKLSKTNGGQKAVCFRL
ncbi:kinesin-like protein KIF14 [Agrilus planipennis]|uniref:Kinesin-like protein n=1 Tax=Agrilus planipennis TaxID=224129 RepID=A0A1W4WJ76_AGRPL|nr:kinesin-like protein KIF14 [Agrilus planipennis]